MGPGKDGKMQQMWCYDLTPISWSKQEKEADNSTNSLSFSDPIPTIHLEG